MCSSDLIATTFTLVAVFLPTAFMAGIAGKFFKQFGWTAALAVVASLLVARMLTPMMAAYILRPAPTHASDGPVMRRYLSLVRWCLEHRWVTLGASIAFFVGSVMLIPLLPTGFMPPDDFSQSQVHVELPPGSSLEQTKVAAERARQLVMKVPNVKSVYTTIGAGAAGSDPFAPPGASEVRKATLTLMLTPRHERGVRKQVIERQIREALVELPGARFKVGLGGSGEKYILALTGDDPQALSKVAREFESQLRTIPNIGSVTSTAALVRPEIAV